MSYVIASVHRNGRPGKVIEMKAKNDERRVFLNVRVAIELTKNKGAE